MQDDTGSDVECRQLFVLFCNRDKRGSLKFVNTYGGRLRRYISRTRVYDSPEEWDDCLQKVWIKIINYCGKELPEGGCVAFMLVIAKHQAIDDMRANGAKTHNPVGWVVWDDNGEGQPKPGDKDYNPNEKELAGNPAKQLEDEEQSHLFKAAVAELPQKQRQAVWLYLSGYSQKQMAECMGEGEETVKTHLRLAKDKLKKKLQR